MINYDYYRRINNGMTDGSSVHLDDYDKWNIDNLDIDNHSKWLLKGEVEGHRYKKIINDLRNQNRELKEQLQFEKSKNLGYNISVEKEKEENLFMFDSTNFMGKFFGKVASGMCRMSMGGDMAIKTSNGYKTYDVKTGSLVNCDNFVFDIGSEFFFIIPTNKVETGDVILASGKPHCVIKVESNRIEALRYEDSSVVTIVPEHHVFMGKTYFYGKIVSMFGKITGNNTNNGMKNMMKYFIMSEMIGKNGSGNGSMNSMLPMMMFMGNNSMENMFEGMFDFDGDETEVEEENSSN